MIWKNFFKDLKNVTSRLASVIIITIVAVMVYVGLNGIDYNADLIVNNYFHEQNIADYWIMGNGFDTNDYKELKNISGINQIENRLVFEASQAENDTVKLLLYGVSPKSTINKPYIVKGRLAENKDEIMISSEFAKEQGLDVGDKYTIKILGSPKELTFKISALIKNPERMYNINSTIPSPNYSKFGFAYANEDGISNILGQGKYNQIVITLDKNADSEHIRNQIVEKFKNKLINIIERKDNVTANNLLDFINGIKPIIQVLPIIFFVIAALLMVSTMSRLIENSRQSIGTLKALGYTDFNILLYYFMYSVIVVLFGFIVGSLLSNIVITKPISQILFGLNDLPPYTIGYDMSLLGKAFILTAISCIGTSFIITRNALKEKPAQCMRPKPPKKESRLLIEKNNVIWDNLGFSKKYIIKNTFRNKARIFTCIVGISACMALILTCLSLKDSINNFTSEVTGNQHKYDVYMTLNTSVNDYDVEKINSLNVVEGTQYSMNTSAIIERENKYETVNTNVSEDTADLKLIDTYDERTRLPLDGVIIGADLANKCNLKVSDYVDIMFLGKKDSVKVKIAEINKDINGMYISKTYFNEIGQTFKPNSVYVKTSNKDKFKESIAHYDFVSDYELKETITDSIVNKISVLSLVVYILIILGGVLAIVVLYNLGIMSFYEQIRSLATLMVLGFYDREIKRLQLTENIIFTILGIIVGIPLGIGLTNIITGALTLANLHPVTKISSYIISALLTFVFANIVNMIIGRMMKKIDMLGALKSVE